MSSRMIACPHCGAMNSERKEKCYGCQQPMAMQQAPARVKTEKPAKPAKAKLRLPDDVLAKPAQVLTRPPSRLPSLLGVTLKQRVQFYRQFQHLLMAGIPLSLTLNHLQENVVKAMRPMIRDLAETAQKGGQLWPAMERYPAVFAEWEVALVRAAEKGGTLPEAMGTIAETLETEMLMRYQTGAKLMPMKATIVTFLMTALIVTSVSAVSSGSATAVFAKVGMALAVLAQLLLAFFLLRMAWRMYTRTRRGARVAQSIIWRMPLIGPIIHLQMLHRFVTVLGALWKAGVSPMDALESAARASNNPLLMQRVAEQLNRLTKGATLSEVLTDTQMLPKDILYMISSGETSGTVSESLERVAEYIRMELDAQIKTLPVRAQLAMYATIGVGIGAFIIWFWLNFYGQVINMLQ